MRGIFCRNLSFYDQLFLGKPIEIVKDIKISPPPMPTYRFWQTDEFGNMYQEEYELMETKESDGVTVAIYNFKRVIR
jgi:hypothetical protein